MHKSKVIEIIRTFSGEELKIFRNYLLSPVHNTNKKVIKLFELVKKYYPEFNSRNINKELIFKKLYPGKKYSDIVMRILISDMLKLAEEFLAYRVYTEDNIAEKKYLLKELEIRKLDNLIKKHLKETEVLLNREHLINSSYFLNRYELESLKYNILIASDKQDKAGNVLEKQGEYLVDYFLINSLNIMQEMNEFSEVLNQDFSINPAEILIKNLNIDNFFTELKKTEYKYYPLLEIYYNLYRFSLNNMENERFYKLKNSIFDNFNKFDENERNNLLLALESCSVTRVRMGIPGSREDLMEVYELLISGSAFSIKKKKFMQANLFRNIFYTAMLLKRTDWAENFVDSYIEFLLPEQRPDMLNYTKAMLFFERNKFDEALVLISKINYTFFVFKYEAKILMIKLYYELNSYEPALSLIDSFSHFLSKNKNVSLVYKEPFMNFLKFTKELIKQRSKPGAVNKVNIYALHKKAESMEHFISKNWIIEKIEQLK